jgi:hypothetical protein
MKQRAEDETELRRYLLGELTQEERAQVEEQLFLNSNYFQQLQAAEDDLIDDYVYEELSATERNRFETYFLSESGRREDLKIAQALRRYISSEVETTSATLASVPASLTQTPATSKFAFLPFLHNFSNLARLSLATAALIILALGIWLIIKATHSMDQSHPPQEAQRPVPQETAQTSPPREELTISNQSNAEPQAEQEQHVERGDRGTGADEKQVAGEERREAARARRSSSESRETSGRSLAVLLIPGSGVRGGGESNKVSLPSDVSLVNLQLPLIGNNDYRSYRVTLQKDTDTIRTWSGLKSKPAKEGNIVSVMVPAKLLNRTNYQIKLSGITTGGETRDIASYIFQVE